MITTIKLVSASIFRFHMWSISKPKSKWHFYASNISSFLLYW